MITVLCLYFTAVCDDCVVMYDNPSLNRCFLCYLYTVEDICVTFSVNFLQCSEAVGRTTGRIP